MKKLLLIIAVIFVSVSGSYAYQQSISAGPGPSGSSGSYNFMQVQINSNCDFVKISVSYTGVNEDSEGACTAAGLTEHSGNSGVLIGEHYDATNYSSTIHTNQYWSTVNVYLMADNCYGVATLEWDTY